jgi:hypothetical protein
VVAADDGVMPQTRESRTPGQPRCRSSSPVNKIDLPDANPERVLGDLAAEGSARSGAGTRRSRGLGEEQTGLDELLGRCWSPMPSSVASQPEGGGV